jgi:hypothetical protein
MYVCGVIFGIVMVLTGFIGIFTGKTFVMTNLAGKTSKDIEGSGARVWGVVYLISGIAIIWISLAVFK